MIATSIVQSKKLLELGIDTKMADLSWTKIYNEAHIMSDYRLDLIPYRFNSGISVPAWSLSVLIELIPVHIITDKLHLRLRMDKGENDFSIWYDDFNGCCVYEDADFTCENPIDAAVEMIEWIYKNGYLGKEAEK